MAKSITPGPGYVGKLDVFHDDVRVVFCRGMAHLDGNTVWGFFDATARLIEISETEPHRMRAALLHEYLHACIGVMHGREAMGEDAVTDPEEMFVRASELGIVHLFRIPSNRWAADYLFGKPL